jgi:hypothetical protein
MPEKICALCGEAFTPNRNSAKYCSEECRKRVKYNRDRAWVAENAEKVKAYQRRYYVENGEYLRADKVEAYRLKCKEAFKKNNEKVSANK